MNEQTTTLLKQLADKLGTTTDYLWHVLLNHAHVSAFYSILNSLIFSLIIFGSYKYYKRKSSLFEDEDGFTSVYGFVFIFLCIVSVLSIIIIGQSIKNAINGFFDPEYWALDTITDFISK